MCEEIETETRNEQKAFCGVVQGSLLYISCIVRIKAGQEVDFKHTDGRTASTANKQLARA